MKRIAQVISLAAVLTALSACSGNGVWVSGGEKTPQTGVKGMTAGNWYFSATSQMYPGNIILAQTFSGPLAVSSDSVSLTPSSSSTCLPSSMPLVFSGTVSGNSVTISSPPISGNSKVLTMTGIVYNGSNFDGVYQITGAAVSDICYGDAGTVYGILIPPLDGSWSGYVVENAYSDNQSPKNDKYGKPIINTAYVYATIAQDAAPVTISTNFKTIIAYPLSGTMTFYNSLCYSSGTVDHAESYIEGPDYHLVVKTDTGVMLVVDNPLDPTRPNSMDFGNTVQSGACHYYQVVGKLQSPGLPYNSVQ
jgi:hypothetical protein